MTSHCDESKRQRYSEHIENVHRVVVSCKNDSETCLYCRDILDVWLKTVTRLDITITIGKPKKEKRERTKENNSI